MGNVYCMADIHNDRRRFREMLRKINFTPEDQLYILGDVFGIGPDPLGLYREIIKYDNIVPVRGNNDDILARSICENDDESTIYRVIRKRLTKADLLKLAEWIEKIDLQKEIEVDGEKYLLAHVETTDQPETKNDGFFMRGEELTRRFLLEGVKGYTSIIGDYPTDLVRFVLQDFPEFPNTIWRNWYQNVYCIDCGNTYRWNLPDVARLGCLRLNDKKEFYV